MSERIERPFKGHLIVSESCEWFRTTDVGRYRISSIGEYVAPAIVEPTRGRFTEIGYNRLYETMVFRLSDIICTCGCDAPEIHDWSEVAFRGYNSRTEAEEGHEAMVASYMSNEVAA